MNSPVIEVKITGTPEEVFALLNRALGDDAQSQTPAAADPLPGIVPPVVAPAPAEVPAAPAPAPTPAPVAPAEPTGVPVAAPATFTVDQIATAIAGSLNTNPNLRPALQQLLTQFGLATIMDLKPDQCGAFATQLRGMGVQI